MTGLLDLASSVAAPPDSPKQRRALTALIEEQLIIPSYASRWATVTIAVHRALSLPLQLAGDVHRRTVPTKNGSLEVVTVGREKLIEPICQGLFGTVPEARPAGRRFTRTAAGLATTGADLVLAEVHRWVAPWFRKHGWLIVPRSVRWQGDLTEVPPRVLSKSLQANMVKMRRQNFTLLQGSSADDWKDFYQTMVEPQAKVRHGPSAWVASEPFLRKLSEKGTLHFIMESGVRVAGLCTVPFGDTLWFPLMGVRQGDPELLRRGASVAAVALPVEWARARNFRRIDLGRTGSFVNDGLQRYKRRWGLSPVVDPLSLVTAVWIGSAQGRKAFAREPVLVGTAAGVETYDGESA